MICNFETFKQEKLFQDSILPLLKKEFHINDYILENDQAFLILATEGNTFVFLTYYPHGKMCRKITVEQSLMKSETTLKTHESKGDWYVEQITTVDAGFSASVRHEISKARKKNQLDADFLHDLKRKAKNYRQ